MIRAITSEILPFLIAVGLVAVFFLYTSIGGPMLGLIGLLYLMYRRLAKMEYYLSEEFREAMFWRDRNWHQVQGLKWACALLLIGAAYTNQRQNDRFVRLDQFFQGSLGKEVDGSSAQQAFEKRLNRLEERLQESMMSGGARAVGQAGNYSDPLVGKQQQQRSRDGAIGTQLPKRSKQPAPILIPEPTVKKRQPLLPVVKKQPAQTGKRPANTAGGGLPFEIKKTGEN